MEYILIFIFICIQLLFFLTTYFRIQRLSDLFPPITLLRIGIKSNGLEKATSLKSDRSKVQVDEYIKIEIENEKKGINIGFISIINSTNEYLKNNSGSAVDFNIIRDIAERINSAYENSIQSTISIPLYIGLLGTMFGIVYGIFNIRMPLDDSSLFTLLDGVKLAMIASIAGLFLTLINSSFVLKNVSFNRDLGKNNYYTFIQTSLLPILTKDMVSSLSNIQYQLAKFNKEFFDNIQMLKVSLEMISENIKNQKDVIETINEIRINDIAKVNLEILDKFEKSTKSFNIFVSYQTDLNSLIEKFSNNINLGNEMITQIVSAKMEISEVLNVIKKTVNSNRDTSEFLKMNFAKLKAIDDTTRDIVSQQEKSLRDVTVAFARELENTNKTLIDKYKDNLGILTKELDNMNVLFREELVKSVDYNLKALKVPAETESIQSNTQEVTKLNEILTTIKLCFDNSQMLQTKNNDLLEVLYNEMKIVENEKQIGFFKKFKLFFKRDKN